MGEWKPICATNDGRTFRLFTSYCGMERTNCDIEIGAIFYFVVVVVIAIVVVVATLVHRIELSGFLFVFPSEYYETKRADCIYADGGYV